MATKADATSPITSWAVRHSSVLRGRYLEHASDKKTSFNRRWGRGDATPLADGTRSRAFRVILAPARG
eukprot:13552951-Alexandrium_andersonii.AAC.1